MIEKLNIRRAREADSKAVSELLAELDLMRPYVAVEDFRVALQDDRVVGMAHVEAAGDAIFISSVGVANELQGSGIGSKIINTLLAEERRDAFVYTIIPSFFARLGFVEIDAPAHLPKRELFCCDKCEPLKCVCMMRHSDVS